MAICVNNERFAISHEVFKRYMLHRSGGVPFTSFQHPFLVDDEIAYKWGVYDSAKRALSLSKWEQWKRTPGRIIEAVKAACRPNVSANLLEHRYGLRNSSEGALYKVNGVEQIKGLETQLFDFFLENSSTPTEFGPRFDALANYLRAHRLGCNWAFLSYLAFLLRPQTYFPIRPSQFDALLQYYGIGESISGHVSWERYSILLELAKVLKSKLAAYGQADAIEIQSYMWVVSYLIKDETMLDKEVSTVADFDSALAARVQKAKERERIGLLGEQYVYEQEINKLREAQRNDLADKVRIVSLDGEHLSFDILSFDPDGRELHIEVKTTARSLDDDHGFWLSENERLQAEQDVYWVIYRVWNIDLSPSHENLGNIVVGGNESWELVASSWYARRKTSSDTASQGAF
jgi:hypothetical protein